MDWAIQTSKEAPYKLSTNNQLVTKLSYPGQYRGTTPTDHQ